MLLLSLERRYVNEVNRQISIEYRTYGVRTHELEINNLKDSCEDFAKNYLTSIEGATIGSEPGRMDGGEARGGLLVIGSYVAVNGTVCKHLLVAPWARSVVTSGVAITGPSARKSPRSFVRYPPNTAIKASL